MAKALICGVSGQDGALLARLLLGRGYQVWGTTRDIAAATGGNLARLGIARRVTLLETPRADLPTLSALLQSVEPEEVYLLGGLSSVSLSFERPAEAMESIVPFVLNMLEAIRTTKLPVRLYNASSSECFGDIGEARATEESPLHPRSPYAVAKAAAHLLVRTYRESYGLHASNGIAFNHESWLRPERFVTGKIVAAAKRIRGGSGERLKLGRLDVVRDWGWAPEYVEAMALVTRQDQPSDYVLATGESHSLEELVAAVFAAGGMDWRDHVDADAAAMLRPSELRVSRGDPGHAARRLGWRARSRMPDVARMMMLSDAEAEAASAPVADPVP